jgi:hypothetical protein
MTPLTVNRFHRPVPGPVLLCPRGWMTCVAGSGHYFLPIVTAFVDNRENKGRSAAPTSARSTRPGSALPTPR